MQITYYKYLLWKLQIEACNSQSSLWYWEEAGAGTLYQTAISHHSNKSRINTNYMKHELMAILGVLLGESHWGFPCSSSQGTVKLHYSLIPKSQGLSPCPAAWLDWNDGIHQVLGWVKSPSRSFSCRQIPQLNESSWAWAVSWACLNIAPHSQTPRSYK